MTDWTAKKHNTNIAILKLKAQNLYLVENIKLYQLRKPTTLTLIKRPSAKIKSPYVSDGILGNQTYTIHTPALDMGGQCIEGTKLICVKSNETSKTDYIACAIKLEEAILESCAPNSPLSKRVNMIGSANITNPITAGKPIKNISLIDQSKVLENCSLLSLANRLDNLGKITVAIAMAKIPRGNCINLSET